MTDVTRGTKMKRLTERTAEGAVLEMADTYQSEDAARLDLMKRFRLAVERLADYEDTGLEPEEVKHMLSDR